MEKLKEVLLSKQAKRFYWTTFAGFLGLLIIYFQGLSYAWVPVATAIIAGITKEVNNYLSEG